MTSNVMKTAGPEKPTAALGAQLNSSKAGNATMGSQMSGLPLPKKVQQEAHDSCSERTEEPYANKIPALYLPYQTRGGYAPSKISLSRLSGPTL